MIGWFLNMRNLLPEEKKKVVNREYILRLITVSLWLLFLVVIVGIALVLPSFLMVQSQASALHSRKSLMEQTVVVRQSDVSMEGLRRTDSHIEHLKQAKKGTLLTELISSIVDRAPEGVKLTNFSYSLSGSRSEEEDSDKEEDKERVSEMRISGVAEKREELISFSESLKELEYIQETKLPVSQLAEGQNVSFSFTLKGNF